MKTIIIILLCLFATIGIAATITINSGSLSVSSGSFSALTGEDGMAWDASGDTVWWDDTHDVVLWQ